MTASWLVVGGSLKTAIIPTTGVGFVKSLIQIARETVFLAVNLA